MWVGANFLFGHDRAGNFSLLRALGGQHGFKAEKIDPVRYKDFVVSSTRVRRLVSEGRMDEAGALLAACRARGIRLATAEGCTGGLIAAVLTEITGSSDVLECGFVAYSNAAKSELLGVPPETIAALGAMRWSLLVSSPTMSARARRRSSSDEAFPSMEAGA